MDYRHIICLIAAVFYFFFAFSMFEKGNNFAAIAIAYFASEFIWHALGWQSHIH